MTTVPTAPSSSALRAARRRDQRVYTRSHPVLFALLAAARRRAVTRVGGAVLVHGTEPYRQALTRIPLDRTAAGTTGGAARELSAGGTLFDQEGTGHRATRRAVAADLGAAGVERLRPVWQDVLVRRLSPLAGGRDVDLVPVARELAGATVCALLGIAGDPEAIAEAAAGAAAAAVRDHLPRPGHRAPHGPPPRRRPGWSPCSTRPAVPAREPTQPCGPCSRSPPSTPPSPPSPVRRPGAPTRASGTRRPTTGCARPWWTNCCA
ncbi:hypothetical protein [Streptomyces sp. ML-6]|uniref:hypothetical protein n=1 Tax=Streptomyces sp. ML-6 TaxID=2982693 RepID=UPI0024C03F11|nr:hypothetical protein [Streptomyces sp. ML-6]MDK0524104.1 cytochrome P450 [Streptomyces sp. ML-6]